MYELYKNISYTLEELQKITNINRLDNIERSLKKYGYKYTKTGKGKKVIITILEEPSSFKIWALKKGFKYNTDFEKLYNFLKIYYNTPSLLKMPVTQQVEILNQIYNLNIHLNTAYYYLKQLIKIGIISRTCTKIIFEKANNSNIWEEVNTDEYKEFFSFLYKNNNNFSLTKEKFQKIFICQPFKEFNAFYKEELEQWFKKYP